MTTAAEAFIALAKQSGQNTAATTLFKALATVSRAAPIKDQRQVRVEHPASASRYTRRKSKTQTPSYLGGANASFALYPKFIGAALLACGFQVTTVDNTTYYTHTFTLGSAAAHKWMTAAWYVPTSTAFTTRLIDARAQSLNVNGTTDEILCDMVMRSLSQGQMSGSPTYTAEESEEILPWLGSRTLTINGKSITENVQGCNLQITNNLDQNRRSLWTPNRTDLPPTDIDVGVVLTDIDLTKDLYYASFYGATGGSAVDLDPVVGSLEWEWQSANNISGAGVPYRFAVDIPSVEFFPDPDSMPAQNADVMTMNINAFMTDDVTTPISIELDNDVSAY